jgi:dephospho-CoA kinase
MTTESKSMNLRRKKKSVILGITGGIASGKSSVVKEFAKLGARVIDSDVIARKIVRPKSNVWKRIVKCFGLPGKDILLPGNLIDRKKLAVIIFSDSKKRKVLEKITHPVIIKEIKKQLCSISCSFNGLIIVDAPLLFEAGLESTVDKILVVRIPKEMQIARLRKRDSLSRRQAIKRINTQMPLGKKVKLADYVIDNSKAPKLVRQKIHKLWRELFLFPY